MTPIFDHSSRYLQFFFSVWPVVIRRGSVGYVNLDPSIHTHMHCIKCRLLYMLCCWINQSVSVFIRFFLIRIRKIHLYNLCTFIRWLLCVLLSRFSVKSAKAVTCGLPCHLDRKFLKMWKSWRQSFPLIKKEDKQKNPAFLFICLSSPYTLVSVFHQCCHFLSSLLAHVR